MNLSTARVFVRDLQAAEAFYTNKLGLSLSAGGAQFSYCVFAAGNTQLVVEVVAPDAPREEQALIGRFTGLSFTVADINAKYKELVSLGVAFSGAPEAQAWGGILATLQDPAGNKLQLVQIENAV